jgi:hypothetical protein
MGSEPNRPRCYGDWSSQSTECRTCPISGECVDCTFPEYPEDDQDAL